MNYFSRDGLVTLTNAESELWQLRGQFPVLWTIPVYMKTIGKHEEAQIMPAIPLLRCQELAYDQLLKPVGRRVNGLWLLPKREFVKLAGETSEGDPELYFSWESRRVLRQTHPIAKSRKNMQQFLDEIYQLGIGRSREDVEYIWRSFCNHMLDWLINKERPVDLYFARLHPSLYRRAWLEKLRTEAPWKFRSKRGIRVNKRLVTMLSSAWLLEVSREGWCHRNIDVELDPSWWNIIRNVETIRMLRLNPYGYAQIISDAIGNRAEISLKLFSDYMASNFTPYGAVRKGKLAGTFRIHPIARVGSRSFKGAPLNKKSKRLRRLKILHAKSRISKRLSFENGKLQTMRVIQPKVKDVRDGWAEVPKSKNAKV